MFCILRYTNKTIMEELLKQLLDEYSLKNDETGRTVMRSPNLDDGWCVYENYGDHNEILESDNTDDCLENK